MAPKSACCKYQPQNLAGHSSLRLTLISESVLAFPLLASAEARAQYRAPLAASNAPAKKLYGAVGPDPGDDNRSSLSDEWPRRPVLPPAVLHPSAPQSAPDQTGLSPVPVSAADAQAQAVNDSAPSGITEPPRLFGRFFVDPDVVSASNQQAVPATSVGVTDQEMPASDQEMPASRRPVQARSVPQQVIVAQAPGAGGAPVPPAPFTPCRLSRRYRQLPQVRSSRFAGSMLRAQRCGPMRRSSACSSLMWAATRVMVMCKRSVWTALGPTSRTTLIQRIPRQLCLA